MVQTANGTHRSGFAHWLRTGRLPIAIGPEGIELKFDPWHDSENGRFTFVGAGSRYGSSATDPTDEPGARASPRTEGPPRMGDRRTSHVATLSKSKALPAGAPVGNGKCTVEHAPSKAYLERDAASRPGTRRTRLRNLSVASVEGFTTSGRRP